MADKENNHVGLEESHEMLRKVGFTANGIDRLSRLRGEYHEREMGWTVAEYRRLDFIRWLITSGRLEEQFS